MFAVPLCLGRDKGWFSGKDSASARGRAREEPSGWGACIDVPALSGCDGLRRSRRAEDETIYRNGEVVIDDQGLRMLPEGDRGWHHLLSSARKASAQAHQVCTTPCWGGPRGRVGNPAGAGCACERAQRFKSECAADSSAWCGQDCEDSLSVASTHVEEMQPRSPAGLAHSADAFGSSFWREEDSTLQHARSFEWKRPLTSTAAPVRSSKQVSLSGLGIKPKGKQTQPRPAPGMLGLAEGHPGLKAQVARSKTRGGDPWAGELEDVVGMHSSWRDRACSTKASAAAMSASKDPALVEVHTPSSRKVDVSLRNLRKIQKVGKGSTSVVWRCEDTRTQRPLAMKELVIDNDEEHTTMALRELITMYGIDHVGIVTCHNVFYKAKSFLLVMEYMDGGSLLDAMRHWCAFDGTYSMPPPVLAAIAHDVLGALEFLHEELQVVHRDVKPGNILLQRSGQAKLADLGIVTRPGQVSVDPRSPAPAATTHVKASSTGVTGEEDASVTTQGLSALALEEEASTPARSSQPTTCATEWIGTVTYMSPERLVGDAYSYSADVWSLGIVLIEAAIGRYPFADPALGSSKKLEFWDLLDLVRTGECPAKVLESHGDEWRTLQEFAAKCLVKDPAKRPRAADLVESWSAARRPPTDHQLSPEAAVPTFMDLVGPDSKAALAAWVEMSLMRRELGAELYGEGSSVSGSVPSTVSLSRASSVVSGMLADDASAAGSWVDTSAWEGVSETDRNAEDLRAGLVEEEGLEEDGWL